MTRLCYIIYAKNPHHCTFVKYELYIVVINKNINLPVFNIQHTRILAY